MAAIKTKRFIKRCPVYRTSFESIKNCIITVNKKDGSSQTIRTSPEFLKKSDEPIQVKTELLAEAVSGLTGYDNFNYQIT